MVYQIFSHHDTFKSVKKLSVMTGVFGEYFGSLFLATVRNVKKFLAVARHGQTKLFPNMVNINIELLEI